MTTIPLIKPDLPSLDQIQDSFREVLDNGRITNFGKYVSAFEDEAGVYLGTQTATTSSGTMALIFALQALGLQPGDKVIVPSFTFMATAQAILYAGGIPVFADIQDDLTLSTADLELLLTLHEDVTIVIPVHTYGMPCHIGEIQHIVDTFSRLRSHPISILYDAAHAFGSALEGRRVGGFGTAEVFSLSVTKMLVTVEGGLISSRDPELIRRVRKMRNYGIEENYNAMWAGLNGKMSEFHAIVGLYNLRRLDILLAQREKNAQYYLEQIRNSTTFETLPWPKNVVHTFKDFTILVPPGLLQQRDAIIAQLKQQGVETRAYFHPPVHEQQFFRRFADRPLPCTEDLARRVITLPFYTSITEFEMDYVVASLALVWKSYS